MKLALCKCLLEATVPQKKKPGGEADGRPSGRAVAWGACLQEVGLVDQAGGGLRELTRWRHLFNGLIFAFRFYQKRVFQESW